MEIMVDFEQKYRRTSSQNSPARHKTGRLVLLFEFEIFYVTAN